MQEMWQQFIWITAISDYIYDNKFNAFNCKKHSFLQESLVSIYYSDPITDDKC